MITNTHPSPTLCLTVDLHCYLVFANLEMAISSPILQVRNSRLEGLCDLLTRWALNGNLDPIIQAHLTDCPDNGDRDVTVFDKSQGDVFHVFSMYPTRLSISLTLMGKSSFKIHLPKKLWPVVERGKF